MTALIPLFRVYARYWRRHKLQAALSLLGIVLGVAVFVAIRLANQGAVASFRENVETFAGTATHRVFSPAGGTVPESLFVRLLASPAVEAATPYMKGRMWIEHPAGAPATPVTVHGIDPISGADFRSDALEAPPPEPGNPAEEDRRRFDERLLAEQDTILLSRPLAESLSVVPGMRLRARTAAGWHTLKVLDVYDAPRGKKAALADAAVADIATFQEIFGRLGILGEIRLQLKAGGEGKVSALLPPGIEIEAAGRGGERVAAMAEAFQLNLEALALFALLVAGFLIFNASTFSIVQRSTTLGFLRCIGASRTSLAVTLLLEGLLLGTVGGLLGVLCGLWLAEVMLNITASTVAEVILEWESTPAALHHGWAIWAEGTLLGMAVAALGVLAPALEGARASPLAAIRGAEGPALRNNRPGPLAALSVAGLGCLGAAWALSLPERGPLAAGLLAATLVAVGGALLCPLALVLLSRAGTPVLGRLFGPLGRMAGGNLRRSLTRSGVAAASLMVALALALAIDITVRSFRQTFDMWMEQALTGDLYLSMPDEEGGAPLSPQLLALLRAQPWTVHLEELRSRKVVLEAREVRVLALDLRVFDRISRSMFVGTEREAALAGMERGEAFLSETLARALKLGRGDSLALPSPGGRRELKVAAIIRNYTLPSGVLYLESFHYRRIFGPEPVHDAALWLKPGVNAQRAASAIAVLPGAERLEVKPNAAVRGEAMRVFDRTFAITDLMGSFAAFVAFIAVVSALTAVLEERLRTLGYLRAIGVSRRVLGLTMALEAALLAFVAALMSWGAGVLMAMVLIFVVNRRAFGWTLQFHPEAGSYLFLLALALGAALLGSIYPIYRATRLSVVATIREE